MDLTDTGVCNPGGGALCAIQAGELKALYEFYTMHNAKPRAVRGSSGGDLNSCLFVQAFADDGDSIFLMEKLWKTISHHKVHTMIPHIYPRSTGLFKLTPLLKQLKANINPQAMIDSGIDYRVRATQYGDGFHMDVHPLDPAFLDMVVASASYPIVFKPRKIWGKYWADAGINNNLPLSRLIQAGCTKLFVMRTSPPRDTQIVNKLDLRMSRLLGRIISEMMETQITLQMNEIEQINHTIESTGGSPEQRRIKLIDVVPPPLQNNHMHVMEFNAEKCTLAFDNGYRSARKFLVSL